MLFVVCITGQPDTIVRDLDLVLNSSGRLSPLEVEDVVRHVVPVLTDIFGVVELLVDAAGLVVELSASGPGGSQGPRALGWMEQELLNALARVESLDVATAVLRNPVDSVCTNKDNKLIVVGTLNHLMHMANFLLLVSNAHSLLMEKVLQTFPGKSSVT